jgi:hypothetical protein
MTPVKFILLSFHLFQKLLYINKNLYLNIYQFSNIFKQYIIFKFSYLYIIDLLLLKYFSHN